MFILSLLFVDLVLIIGMSFQVLSIFFVMFVSNHWDSVRSFFFVHLVSYIIGKTSQVQYKLNILFVWLLIIATPSQVLSRFFIVSRHWDTILCSILVYSLFVSFLINGTSSQVLSQFFLSLVCLFFFPLVSHLCYTILDFILVFSFFIWFLFIGMPSQILSNLNRFFLPFLNIGTPSQVLFKFDVCSFGLSSLGHYRRFYLNLFFVELFSYYWDPILRYLSLNVSSFRFSSIGLHLSRI